MATYPSSILVKADVTNEVDVVDQNDHNILKGEIIAMQTYIGTTPQGGRTCLMDRFNAQSSGSGGFFITNADWSSTGTWPGRYWYRTDLEILRVTRSDGTIQSIGGSPSNVLFCWNGAEVWSTGVNGQGLVISTGLNGNFSSGYMYFHNGVNAGTHIVLNTKFLKVSGVSGVILHSRVWSDGSTSTAKAIVNINSGAVIGTTTTNATAVPAWVASGVIDVSGLANGTAHNMAIILDNNSNGHVYLATVIVFGQ